MKKWASRFVKISFFLFAFLAIILTVMVNMGGNSDTLKGAIEDYLARATGYYTQIGTLNKMSFYPYITIDIERIEMRQGPEREIAVNAQSAVLSFGFWDLFLSRRQLRDLNVQNVVITPGAVFDRRVVVNSLEIDEDANGQAFMVGRGAIGEDAFDVTVEMEVSGKKNRYRYGIGEESAVNASIGALGLTGIMRPRALGGFHLRDFTASNNNAPLMAGTLSVIRSNQTDLNLKGSVTIPTSNASAEIDLEFTSPTQDVSLINGSVDADSFVAADFKKGAPIMNALDQWRSIFANKNRPTRTQTVNVELNAKIFKNNNGQDIQNFSGVISASNDGLIITPSESTQE